MIRLLVKLDRNRVVEADFRKPGNGAPDRGILNSLELIVICTYTHRQIHCAAPVVYISKNGAEVIRYRRKRRVAIVDNIHRTHYRGIV